MDKQRKGGAAKVDSEGGHVWGKTNPLKFPSHLYTKGVFKANYPLIKIVSGEELMPAFDKFALPLVLDAEVRRAAIALCSAEFTRFFKLCGKAFNEKQLTEFHHSLIRNLENMTIPSDQTLKSLQDDQLLYESLVGKKRKRIDLPELADFSDQLGMLLQLTEERISQDLDGQPSSDHDLVLDPEHAQDDEASSSGVADMKLYVAVKRAQELVKKLVAIIEFKFLDTKQAGYQGACYACREAPLNMKHLHTNPIYILCFSQRWKRAILHLRGEVLVKNGELDLESLPAFRKTEQMMGFKDTIPEAELVEILQERTIYLQSKHSQSAHSVYPDNKYLVGTLYVSDKWHELPRNELFGGAGPDTHRLYEGLLRTIVGDAIFKWNKDMVDKVIRGRKSIRREERALHTGIE